MAEKIVNGVLKNNTKERNETLKNNKGKYQGYNQQLNVIVGENYRVYANEKNPVIQEQHEDILRYTHNGKTEFSKNIHEKYGVDKETLKYYSRKEIKPSFKVNDYDGYDNYISYMWDVYGMEESYAGHLAGLMGVRELAENLAYDIVPSFEGKSAQDVINEIMQYSNPNATMEANAVGIVRNVNVANAVNGVVTTNINNFSGKETKMGLISNRMYGMTLLRGAQFNSMRHHEYITPELDKLYGNNLNNVYNLGALFSIDTESGRIIEPDSGKYLGMKMPNGNIFDYLPSVIQEFKLPDGDYKWDEHPKYGIDEQQYEKQQVNNINATTVSAFDSRQLYVYSEGDTKNESDNINAQSYRYPETELITPITSVHPVDDIEISKESLLSKTNKFLKKRQINTILSRFNDVDNKNIGITQSSVSRFGISHGRNLLTKGALENGETNNINGYSNPYCRVWTAHHQYSKMKHLIRPFTEEENFMPISELQKNWYMFRNQNGGDRLSDYGALNKNGMVNITPTSDGEVDVKKCMFSIENLAWRDVSTNKNGCYRLENGEFVDEHESVLSEEQRGEHGGRIMWFPPYDLNFQETATANWSSNDFIGRGEPVYTYVNSKRSGTLDFTLLVDHPSIVNHWILDKKNNASESDEQTLLRFFAGCEAIDPNLETLYYLNNGLDINGAYKDPTLQDKEDAKDIVFYTFFPNYYTGCEDGKPTEDGLEYIFKGYKQELYDTTNSLFLGYEMGVNPISINNIVVSGNDEEIPYHLDKIYDYAEAEKIYGERLSDFEETFALTKEDLLAQVATIDADSFKYYYTEFSEIIDAGNQSTKESEKYLETIVNIEEEKEELEVQLSAIEQEIIVLQGKLNEVHRGTTAYNQIKDSISTKVIEKNSIIFEIRSKEKNKILTEISKAAMDDLAQKASVVKNEIEEKFNVSAELCCTTPLYLYFRYFSGEESIRNDENFNTSLTAAEAYSEWKINHLEVKQVDDINHIPYSLLKSDEMACRTICSNVNKFWVKEFKSNEPDLPYIEVDNKKDFIKKDIKLGFSQKNNGERTYYVKIDGSIQEIIEKSDADRCAINLGNIPIMTVEEFKESNEMVAIMANDDGTVSDVYTYMYYGIKEVTKDNAKNEILRFLNEESGNSDSYIVEKYYKDRKFGSFKDFELGETYGVFQLFYTGKLQENGEMYKTPQDAVARHNFIENTILPKPTDESDILEYRAEAIIDDEDSTNKLTATIRWDLETPIYSYPIDDLYRDKILNKNGNKNYYDMKSFGLNSTLEAVKQFTKSPDATFSFGEVYAALKGGDNEKEFVLSCERGILQNVLKKEGKELEQLVQEAADRIEYLKKVFKTSSEEESGNVDTTTDLKITEIITKGTASSHGTTDVNKTLSDNREKMIKHFLKSFPIMSDIEPNKEGNNKMKTEDEYIVPVSEGNEDISSEEAKVGRCARTIIVVGKKNMLESERLLEEEQRREKVMLDIKAKKNMRYDNERYFFEMLKENDSVAYNRLVDKVKYFSPAFHSITPEGFNARLTFLHQCTRQGPTVTSSDIATGTTADNLAFGRAPFCILRLGDFLNTKIVINSINITYPDSQWDLNPEGIGVQFMMAKVSMQIDILGGSDLSGPINRLQNAVSFNYYANTSIYDNRSDIATSYTGGTESNNITQRQWFPHPKPKPKDSNNTQSS